MAISWQTLDVVTIPARPSGFWAMAQEFIPGCRILRIRTLNEDQQKRVVPMQWNPVQGRPCGPDGQPPDGNSRAGMLCTSAAYGALIGKIGGSTADVPDTSAGTSGPYGNKKVFAVGTDAVITLATLTDGGPLFLTMNDKPEEFTKHSGELLILIEYYPL